MLKQVNRDLSKGATTTLSKKMWDKLADAPMHHDIVANIPYAGAATSEILSSAHYHGILCMPSAHGNNTAHFACQISNLLPMPEFYYKWQKHNSNNE